MENLDFEAGWNFRLSITELQSNEWSLKIACVFTWYEVASTLNSQKSLSFWLSEAKCFDVWLVSICNKYVTTSKTKICRPILFYWKQKLITGLTIQNKFK